MSAAEVIAEAQDAHGTYRLVGNPAKPTGWLCRCGVECKSPAECREHRAEAVLAAIRAMTPEQQAELIGGEVQPCSVNPECGHHVRIVREVRRELIDADVTRDHEEDER